MDPEELDNVLAGVEADAEIAVGVALWARERAADAARAAKLAVDTATASMDAVRMLRAKLKAQSARR